MSLENCFSPNSVLFSSQLSVLLLLPCPVSPLSVTHTLTLLLTATTLLCSRMAVGWKQKKILRNFDLGKTNKQHQQRENMLK